MFHFAFYHPHILNDVNARKAVSSAVTSIILLVVTLFLAFTVANLYKEGAFSNVKVEVIEYSYIYCTINMGVGNARWKIVYYVFNRGTEPVELFNVFINDEMVDMYGLVHGDSLSSGNCTGTSLPLGGVNLMNGAGLEVYVWVCDKLFSSGTSLVISLNPVNNVVLSKSIELT